MNVALPTLEPSPATATQEEGRPDIRLVPPSDVSEGGYRFWACARGPEGRSQTTAVWGLWLDDAVVFSADTESIADGDPRVFPASVVQVEEGGSLRVVDGSAERVEDPGLLSRFVSECEAKYGFEPDPLDPDTPVFVVRPGAEEPVAPDGEGVAQEG